MVLQRVATTIVPVSEATFLLSLYLKFRGSKRRRAASSPASLIFEPHSKGIQLQTLHEELIHFLIERLQERLDRAAQSVSKLIERIGDNGAEERLRQ